MKKLVVMVVVVGLLTAGTLGLVHYLRNQTVAVEEWDGHSGATPMAEGWAGQGRPEEQAEDQVIVLVLHEGEDEAATRQVVARLQEVLYEGYEKAVEARRVVYDAADIGEDERAEAWGVERPTVMMIRGERGQTQRQRVEGLWEARGDKEAFGRLLAEALAEAGVARE